MKNSERMDFLEHPHIGIAKKRNTSMPVNAQIKPHEILLV
jgi:hypothetical protein